MESNRLRINTFNLIIGIIMSLGTIAASVGGAYVTTQVILARHDERLKSLEISDVSMYRKLDKQLEILTKIDKTVAVIEERTKR